MVDCLNNRSARVLIRRESSWSKDVSKFHDQFLRKMLAIPSPLGFEGIEPAHAPSFDTAADGEPYLSAPYSIKGRKRGVKFIGDYRILNDTIRRHHGNLGASYFNDDGLQYEWRLANKNVDYHFTLHQNLPMVIKAFGARFATVDIWAEEAYFSQLYQWGYDFGEGTEHDATGFLIEKNEAYNRLKHQKQIDVDGWNNIFTLYPAQYWEGGRCLRALGYGRNEVIRRLSGKVPLVGQLLDGVYVVLNDSPNIQYSDFYEMNVKIKEVLGLI